ncbi:MAG: DNA alkylation repair protein, partial [bacterium]|nr:DNA alkylation repair protein [bacterium]
ELDTWAKELDSYPITDAFASFASKTSLARRRMEKWLRSKQEWTSVAGWALVSSLSQPGGALEDDELETLLGHIEDNIHGAQNRERHSMNNALISIGGRSAGLRKLAVASAKRIGKVEVDRGGTSCKTPDAASYIMKVAAHQKEMAQRRAKKASTKKKATKKKGTKKKGTKKKGTKRVPARRK